MMISIIAMIVAWGWRVYVHLKQLESIEARLAKLEADAQPSEPSADKDEPPVDLEHGAQNNRGTVMPPGDGEDCEPPLL